MESCKELFFTAFHTSGESTEKCGELCNDVGIDEGVEHYYDEIRR
jgi:hypothetical protein